MRIFIKKLYWYFCNLSFLRILFFLPLIINCSSSKNATDPKTIDSSTEQIWKWSLQWGISAQTTSVGSISTDTSSNVVVIGSTNSDLTTCLGSVATCSGSSIGIQDYYLTKFNVNGIWLWTKQLGQSSKSTFGVFSSMDAADNIYIGGYTNGNLATCDGISAQCTGASTGSADAIVSKYDENGNWQWTKQLGQLGKYATVTSMAVSTSGDTYLTGLTNGNLESCLGSSVSCSGTSQGLVDLFVIKFNSNGDWQWTKQLGQTGKTFINAHISADSSGNAIISGAFDGDILSCNGISSNCSGSPIGSYDGFVVKFNVSGNWQWSRQIGVSSHSVFPYAAYTDKNGNIYVSGETSGNLLSCNDNFSQCSGAATGSYDYFLIKFNSAGVDQWTHQLGSAGKTTSSTSVQLDSFSNVLVAGTTSGLLTGCSGNSLNCNGDSSGTTDYFIEKYDSAGNYIWTKQMGQAGKYVEGINLFLDSNNKIYVGGSTNANIPSCSGDSSKCSGTSYGNFDFFISSYQ